jgi:hypothetical protein
MIADSLIPALKEKFPDSGMRCGAPPDPIAVFPAAHPEVGEVTIFDDGDEVIVSIGEITHGHFGAYEAGLSQEQVHEAVTASVVAFLGDLFADKVVLWHVRPGGASGWYYPSEVPKSADASGCLGRLFRVPRRARRFLWSGPFR